jgi:hypothetical protein
MQLQSKVCLVAVDTAPAPAIVVVAAVAAVVAIGMYAYTNQVLPL